MKIPRYWQEVQLSPCRRFPGGRCWRCRRSWSCNFKPRTFLLPRFGIFNATRCRWGGRFDSDSQHLLMLMWPQTSQLTKANFLSAGRAGGDGEKAVLIMLLFAAVQRWADSIRWSLSGYRDNCLLDASAAPSVLTRTDSAHFLLRFLVSPTVQSPLVGHGPSTTSHLEVPLDHCRSTLPLPVSTWGAGLPSWTEQVAGSPERQAICSIKLRPQYGAEEFFICHCCQVTSRTETQRES